MRQAFIYTLKVWLTTVVVAPILITILSCYALTKHNLNPFQDSRVLHIVLLRHAQITCGTLVFLMPLAIVLNYTVVYLSKQEITFPRNIWYIIGIAFGMALLPDLLIGYYSMLSIQGWNKSLWLYDSITKGLITAIVVTACTWIYKSTLVRRLVENPSRIH